MLYFPEDGRVRPVPECGWPRHARRAKAHSHRRRQRFPPKCPAEAIAKAVESQPDLVILDLSMPGLNGIEVASALHRLLPKVPIVLFTLYGDHVATSFASIFGIKAIVSKSDGMGKLIASVQFLLMD